jgi:hypothetical protein
MNISQKELEEALIEAVKRDNYGIVKLLLDHGVSPNLKINQHPGTLISGVNESRSLFSFAVDGILHSSGMEEFDEESSVRSFLTAKTLIEYGADTSGNSSYRTIKEVLNGKVVPKKATTFETIKYAMDNAETPVAKNLFKQLYEMIK